MYQSTEPTGSSTSQRFSHKRIDDLFKTPIIADKGARYAKRLFLNLSTLSPYVAGPNSVKHGRPLEQYVNNPPNQAFFQVATHFKEQRGIYISYAAIRLVLQSYLYIHERRC